MVRQVAMLCFGLAIAGWSHPARAECTQAPAELPRQVVLYGWNSGSLRATTQGAPTMARQDVISVRGAPWVQLQFGQVSLGAYSYVELTSLRDGAQQRLDAATMAQWGRRSAYFNGDSVEVRVHVDSRDAGVSVNVASVVAGLNVVATPIAPPALRGATPNAPGGSGLPNPSPQSICGVDNRIASTEARVARIDPIGCTAWIIATGELLTAGHCLSRGSSNQTISFNPPASLPDGTVQFPGPEDQYTIDQSSFDFANGGVSNDWGIFTVFNNSQTGVQPIDVQGFFEIRQDYSPATIRITGFGVDSGTTNQTNQTHAGANVGSSGNAMRYIADTTGGNSGSPVIDEATGQSVGIHTHGGCTTSNTGSNKGTSFFNSALWAVVQGAVGGTNNPPVLASIGAQSVIEGNTLSFTVSATDPDGDTVTLSAAPLPANATFNSNTGVFTFSPSTSQAGSYSVVFTANDGRGGTDSETVDITVINAAQSYATLPYSTGFESGSLDQFWTTETSASVGRVQVTSSNSPRGSFQLTMDVTTNNNFSTDAANLHVDLSSQSQVDLTFWWKEFSDENHNEDGVFLSDDGGASFVKVYSLTGGNTTYQQIALDIDALAAANGLQLTSTFVIKFQHRDNYSIATDGFAFDDISVSAGAPPPSCSVSEDFESGGGGWTTSGTCTTGTFVVGTPDPVTNSGVTTQVSGASSGASALFTQPNSGGAGSDDVDGGECIATSPVYNVSANSDLSIDYFFGQRDAGDDANDGFALEVSINGGAFTALASFGDVTVNAAWTSVSTSVSAGDTVQLRVRASDAAGPGDLVEAGVDNLQICAP